MAWMFDTLQYTKGAELVGIPRTHAEYQAEQMSKLLDESLVNKHDLVDLETRLVIKFGGMMVVFASIMISVLGYIIRH